VKTTPAELILTKLAQQLPTMTDLKFVPYPATWLNGERWNDLVYNHTQRSTADQRVDAGLELVAKYAALEGVHNPQLTRTDTPR
jgi:hypothetical protein